MLAQAEPIADTLYPGTYLPTNRKEIMKSMKRILTSMSAACAVAFVMIAMSAPAASAAEHPQATILIASTPAAAPAPTNATTITAVTEQKAIGVFSVPLVATSPEPGATHLLTASAPTSTDHAAAHRIHADREAKGRTSI